jgi:glycosyltransferase involved in cell wall biosynthesis
MQTSHREAGGYSLLEALSCGTTPLVTGIPSSRRIVADAGSLTPVGDAVAMAEAIVDWSAGNRSAQRLAARNRFDSALTFDSIGRELREAYESLASGRPAS